MRKSKFAMFLATILALGFIKGVNRLEDIAIIWIGLFAGIKVMGLVFRAFLGALADIFRPKSYSFEKDLADSIYTRMCGGSSRPVRTDSTAANRRIWEHHKAMNNAAFQEYQAKKAAAYNPNSYETYQKQNRAKAARNKANRPY